MKLAGNRLISQARALLGDDVDPRQTSETLGRADVEAIFDPAPPIHIVLLGP